jgi:hypothetical protein
MSSIADGVLAIVKAATEPLFERIKALESELVALKAVPPVPGPAGPMGPAGADANAEDVKTLQSDLRFMQSSLDGIADGRPLSEFVDIAIEKALTARPLPALPELPDVTGLVAAEVTKAVASLPVPRDGASVTVEDVTPLVSALVQKAVAEIPVPKDGRDGIDGIKGADGTNGADGKDGVGMAGVLIGREGDLVVTLTNGATKSLGVVVGAKGADGAPGTNGRDGVGPEDVDESYEDDGRVLVRKWLRDGSVVKELRHVTKQCIWRGVYEAGKQYLEGDEVTWGGSLWQAKEPTTAKPGEASEASRAWVLKVKRGADGKKGDQGLQGIKGDKGEQGDRGPAKWS